MCVCGMIVTEEESRSKPSTSLLTIFAYIQARNPFHVLLQTAEKRLHVQKTSRFTNARIRERSLLCVSFLGAVAVSRIQATARNIHMFTLLTSHISVEFPSCGKSYTHPSSLRKHLKMHLKAAAGGLSLDGNTESMALISAQAAELQLNSSTTNTPRNFQSWFPPAQQSQKFTIQQTSDDLPSSVKREPVH